MYKYSNTVFLSMEKKLETKRKRLMICLYKNETNSIKQDTLKRHKMCSIFTFQPSLPKFGC